MIPSPHKHFKYYVTSIENLGMIIDRSETLGFSFIAIE